MLFLVVFVTTCLLQFSTPMTEIGCCLDDVNSRIYTVSPHDYDTTSLDIETCRYQCADNGYSYAGLQEGMLCFCTNDGSCNSQSEASCSIPCTGNATAVCGGSGLINSVYDTPKLVSGLAIQYPGLAETYIDTTLNVTYTSGVATKFTLNAQDGSFVEEFTSNGNGLNHNYRKPGKFETVVTAQDAEDNIVSESTLVKVQTKIIDIDLQCPEAVEINTQFECYLDLRQGTDVSLSVYFGDGVTTPMYPADTISYAVGSFTEGVVDIIAVENSVSYLTYNYVTKTNGTIAAWEYIGKGAGIVDFQVYRPTCGVNEIFCLRSYSCISNTAICRQQTNKWSKRCEASSNQVYSIVKQACIDRTTGEVITQDFLSAWPSTLSPFELVYAKAVQVEAGVHYVADSNHFFALSGDVLAVNEVTGGLVHDTSSSACYSHKYTTVSQPAVGSTLDSNVCSDVIPMFKAHMVEPSRLRFSHNYTLGLDVYNVSITVTNDVTGSPVNDSTEIDVQECIDHVRFNVSETGKTNDTISFWTWPHTGNKVTYNWTYDDGETDVIDVQNGTHVFSENGVYSVTVTAWNKICSESWTEVIIIQDSIEDLSINPRSTHTQSASVFGEITEVDIQASQGTNLTYTVNPGDGEAEIVLLHDESYDVPARPMLDSASHYGVSAFFGNTYNATGNYTYNVTVANLVSSKTAVVYFPVQIPITNYSIIQPGVIAFDEVEKVYFKMDSGSHVELDGTFSGTSLFNMSLDETTGMGTVMIDNSLYITVGTYTLEVQVDNLVTALLSDSTTVYIDYNLTNLAIDVDRPYVKADDTVTFNVTMLYGSSYSVNITYNDGETFSEYKALTMNGEYLEYTKEYSVSSIYNTTFLFKNRFGTFIISKLIVVQHPVLSMELTATSPVELNQDLNGLCSLSITFTGAGTVELATDPFIEYEYGVNTNTSRADLVFEANNQHSSLHSYIEYGTYNLTLNISNFVSHMYFTRSIEVDMPMQNIEVTADPPHIKTGFSTIIAVSMTWGSRITNTYDFKDGTSVDEYVDNFNETMSENHTYNSPGIYGVDVSSENTLGTIVTVTGMAVIVQHPIVGLHLSCTRRSLLQALLGIEHVKCDLWLEDGVLEPTNVNLKVFDWGDSKFTDSSLIPASQGIAGRNLGSWRHFWEFYHIEGYTQGGEYTVSLEASNLVSSVNLTYTHNVYEQISGLSKNVFSFDNATGISSTGFGIDYNYFIMEELISLKSEKIKGSHVTYYWDFGDGNTATVYDDPDMVYQYQAPGSYLIRLNASNPLDNVVIQKEIVIQKRVQDISIWTETPRPKNRTFTFEFNAGNIGTDACYFIQFRDENGTCDYYFLGNEIQCIDLFPSDGRETGSNTMSDLISIYSELNIIYESMSDSNFASDIATSGYSAINNHYMSIGVFEVTVYGKNVVSREDISFTVVTTKGPCFNPIVDLDIVNQCALGQACTNGFIQNLKSETTYIYSRVQFVCEATDTAHFLWSAAYIDDSGNEVMADLNETKIYSTNLRTLVVNPKILNYGFVKFYLNVSMDDVPGVETINTTTIEIIRTPLIGEIAGGPSVPKKWNTNATLDAKTNTYDPDVGKLQWDGFQFKWYCKRKCEEWPAGFVSSGYTEILDPTDFTHNCIYNSEVEANKGCFQFDDFDHPGEFGASDGGEITIDTFEVVENDDIDIVVVATKDTRSIVMHQMVRVTDGDPPDISIGCVTNCKNKLIVDASAGGNVLRINANPTNRFSMLSLISGWKRGMNFEYQWKLYQISIPYDPYNIEQFKLEENVWRDGCSTGTVGDNMAIDSNFFDDYPKQNYFYRLKVEALRYGSSPNNIGWGTKDFVLNEPPVQGECYADPQNGTALDTLFNLNCTQDFLDDDLPLKYEVGYRKEESGDVTWFYWGITLRLDKSVNLPAGLESRNYTLDLFIKATDTIGSPTNISTPVQVLPAAPEKVSEVLSNMTSDPDTFLEALTQSSPGEASQMVNTVAELVNAQPVEIPVVIIPEPVDPTLGEEDKVDAALAQLDAGIDNAIIARVQTIVKEKLRENMAAGLAKVEVPDLQSVAQVNIAVQTVGLNYEELTSSARDSIMNVVEKSLAVIQNVALNGDVLAEELEAGTSVAVKSMGCIVQAISARTRGTGTDTSSTVTLSDGTVVNKSEKQKQFEAARAAEEAAEKEKAREQMIQVQSTIALMSTVVMAKKVPGESASTMPSDENAAIILNCYKQFTRELDNYAVSADGNRNKVVMPSMRSIVGDSNETTYFIQTKAVRYSINPFTYSNDSDEVPSNTMIQSLELFNDTDDSINDMDDLSELFEIVVESENKTEPTKYDVSVKENTLFDELLFRKFNLTAYSALHINLKAFVNDSDNATESANNFTAQRWNVYISIGVRPSKENHEFNFSLPLSDDELLNNVKDYKSAITTAMSSSSSNCSATNDTSCYNTDPNSPGIGVLNGVSYTLPDKWTCFISNDMMNNSADVTVYVAIQHAGNDSSDSDPSISSSSSDSTNSDDTFTVFIWFSMVVYTTQCRWWDTEIEMWKTDGCKVLPLTNYKSTYCGCNHLTSFGGGFFVPMNTIDLGDSAFLKLDENPIVFATMVSIMCLYVAGVVWARWMDRRDALMAGSTALLDNDPRDKYLYEMVVFTGQRRNAGTSSKVRFILTGEKGDTGPRLMWDDKRPVLQRKGVDSFILAMKEPLGSMTHLRLWHDNSGNSPSWYFSRMQVTDMQTKETYYFICDRWLAVEEDDGMIDRIVPVAGKQELTSFNHLFWTKTQKNLTDGHIWFSVFQRPPRSRFTRVQRLTCCLALLFSSMMANILFYQQGDVQQPGVKVYRLGPINFTLSQIYVGVVSSLIAFPASILIVSLFRYSAEPPTKSKEKKQAKSPASKYPVPENSADIPAQSTQAAPTTPTPSSRASSRFMTLTDDYQKQRSATLTSINFIEAELGKQKEFLDTGDVSKRLLLTPTPEYSRGLADHIGTDGLQPAVMATHVEEERTITGSHQIAKQKKKFMLPWWCIIIAYLLALATIGVAFWMTVEVAGQFGATKSREWLFSFAISVLESIFISQPLKVLLMALFLALLWKKPEEEEDDRPKALKPDEAWLHNHLTEKDMQNPATVKVLKQYRQQPLELDEEFVKAAREERFKEIKMHNIIREMIFYLMFLYLMMMVAYGSRDPWNIYMFQNNKQTFYDGAYYHGENKHLSMSAIHSRDDFWDWLKYVVLPGVYHPDTSLGNYYPLKANGYAADNQAYLIGSARLRMLRIHTKPCGKQAQDYLNEHDCSYSYGASKLDEDEYMKGWVHPNTTGGEASDGHWSYKSWLDLSGYPHWGHLATYSGGGYVAELGRTMDSALTTIDELVEYRWIDEHTRGIFVEFLLYNPNVNLFGFSQMLVEYPETGAGYSYFKFHVMRLNRYVGTFMFVVMAAELLTIFFIIFYIYKEVRQIIRQKKLYFKSFWNNIELTVIILCLVAIVMFFYRLFIGQRMESKIRDNPQSYHNFQYVIVWDEAYIYLLGMIIFVCSIKLLKLLRFNKKMSHLTSTLQYAAPSLLSFAIMFAIMFSAFAQVAYLMFYPVLYDFATFVRSCETMFSLMLNKFDFKTMREADRIWAPAIVFIFTLFVSFILVNFFVGIILDAYWRVRVETANQSNEYEIVEYMINKFKVFTGIGQPKKPKRKKNEEFIDDVDPCDYVEGLDPNAETAEELRIRVTAMLDKLEMYVIHNSMDKQMMEEELVKMNKAKTRKIFVSN